MFEDHRGTLVMIGGAEDHEGRCSVLGRLVDLCGDQGRMVVVSVAVENQHDWGCAYQRVFSRLGLKDTATVALTQRSEVNSPRIEGMLRDAAGVFFTGGDQLRITSVLGGTVFSHMLQERYRAGTTIIAGTHAAIGIMGQTMIIDGEESTTPPYATMRMAPGLGFLESLIVSQHFTQQGRISRYLSAIAQNPCMLGLGIDEDTAAVVHAGRDMEVVGSGSVTIVDAHGITHSNLSETSLGKPLALSQVAVHVLPTGYRYDLRNRILLV